MSRKLTTAEFIKCATITHGDAYDYSLVVYKNQDSKVKIICKKHGVFEQRAGCHRSGKGCSKCSGRGLTRQDWIDRFVSVHGNKYSYDLFEYKKAHGRINIVCKKHGVFHQTVNNHHSGQGCPVCRYEILPDKLRMTHDAWVKKAEKVHGDRYDYCKSVYRGSYEPVEIICREHGTFYQKAIYHTRGSGCEKCSSIYSPTTDEWVEVAIDVHGDRYDYSKTTYDGAHNLTIITCKVHGDFTQTPHSHRSGSGCPRCPARYDQPTKLYILTNGEQVKVGIALDPESRIKRIRREQPFTAKLITSWTLADHPQARQVESEVHRRLADLNAGLTGFDGATEWFNTTVENATNIIELTIEAL